MAGLGAPELIIILVVILVLFGGAKLPKLARSLGQAQKEFRDGMAEGHEDDLEARSRPADSRPAEPRPTDTTPSDTNP